MLTFEPLAVKFLVVILKSSFELLMLFVAVPKKKLGVKISTLEPLKVVFVAFKSKLVPLKDK